MVICFYIIMAQQNMFAGKPLEGRWHKVILETISQYIGLVDCKGNKIFEGDIFFSINAEERHYGVVKFGEHANNHGNIDIGFYVH